MDKKSIRKSQKSLNLSLPHAERVAQSEVVVGHIVALAKELNAKVVALFSPLADEIDISAALSRLDCRVVLPRIIKSSTKEPLMEFYDYTPDSLARGAYGIEEPQGESLCPESEIDLIVVPGVAFTTSGERLGRGRGYYDSYLSRPKFRGYKVGVCYSHQIVESLPTQPHDKAMDIVFCDKI